MRKIFLLLSLCICTALVHAQFSTDPVIYSWVRNLTGATGYNSIPSNVQSVKYDASNVYIAADCIPGYDIGPWSSNPNTPTNQNFVYKITRHPAQNTGTLTTIGNGHTGVWSNGVSVFNVSDAQSYNNAGVWNRNAYYWEGVSFDACLGHPAPNGEYHNHVNPICLYNETDSLHHSPIIGYAFDGYPIYGAFAYTNVNGTGAIKRIKSSYVVSTATTRVNGPAVSSQYPAGCFMEDYIFTQGAGDLDLRNGRFCVTPEYPGGTYCYFATLDPGEVPTFPYTMYKNYYGVAQSGNTGNGGHNTAPANDTFYSVPFVPSITISASSNPACSGSAVTFSASVTNGGTAPSYVWKKNGTAVSTASTYTSSVLSNHDTISCALTSSQYYLSSPTASSNNLIMTVTNAITSSVTTSICAGSSYAGHTASGTYTDHYTSASGCDSARTLNLTLMNAITSSVTTSICAGSSYAGHTASGTYTDHYTSASGCDSARTLNLTVGNAITSSVTTSICAGSSYAGHTVSGTYTDHYTSASGCDSARTLNLTVGNAITSSVTTSICAGSSYAGHTVSGTYTDHYTSASGCDSARTLNLTVGNAITSSVTTSICAGSSYAGHTVSGTYTDHYTSVSGCDSARTLVLTVKQAATSSITTTINSGQSYTLGTQTFNTTGTYTVTLAGAAANGCDSIVTLSLTVNGTACTPSVSVTCNNTNLDVTSTRIMTATATNGGTNPVYNWYMNGTLVSGIHGSILSYGGALGNGDQIYCTMTPANGCAAGQTVTGNTITFTKSGSTVKDITTLTMPAQVGTSVINNAAATVSAVVTTATAGRTAIHPTRLYVSLNAAYGPSYANNRDFSMPVSYTVRAQDGSSKVWTVTVVDQSGNKTNAAGDNLNTLVDMTVYPDPATAYINLQATGGVDAPVITILDMEGRVIYHQALPITNYINHQVDINDFATGSYIMYLAVGEKLQSRQFVVGK